jgi:hypothetical protein
MFHNKRPLILLLVTIVGSDLVTQQSIGMFAPVYASESSPYDSGHKMGCDEATSGLTESKTMDQLEGYAEEFVRGYYDGFTWCDPVESPMENVPPNIEDNPVAAPFDSSEEPSSQQGGIECYAACQLAHTVLGLQTPCDELVTPNNELTSKGEQVLACYAGGALAPLLGPAAAARLYTLGEVICPP